MTKIFKIPFATQGDRTAVPDDVQADGSLSYTQGYGYDYERDQATDPAAKDIEREKMNSIFHDITGAVGEIQAFGMPVWAEEGKPYAIRSVVYHNKKAWQSKIENNNTEPAAGVAWTELKADVTAEDVGAYTKVEANLKFQPVGNYADKNEVNGKLAKDQNGADIQDKEKFIENLGLGEALKKGDFGVGGRVSGHGETSDHVGGFFYEPSYAGALYPEAVAVTQSGGPTGSEWGQVAVSYGPRFSAYIGRQNKDGKPEISELYHDKRKPTADDVGAQPSNSTLSDLSGKNKSELREYLELGTAALSNIGTASGQVPDMSSFKSGSTSSSFWYKFPNGMFMVGGYATGITSGSSGNGVYFPVPFPNSCSSVTVTLASAGLYEDTVSFNTYIPGKDRFNIYTNKQGNYAVYFLAFGS